MLFGLSAVNDVEAQDFRDDARGLSGAVDAMLGELIGRQALRVERAEARFVAEEWADGHGHTAREQDFDGCVEPHDRHAGGAEKFRRAWLRVSATTEREHDRFFQLKDAAQRSSQ